MAQAIAHRAGEYGAVVSQFQNEPLAVGSIPRLADKAFIAVDKNYLRASLLVTGLFAVAVLAGGVILAAVVPRHSWLPLVIMLALLVATALAAVRKVLEVRNIAYQVRDHDVSYRSGVIIKSVETIPFVRVQHARIRQGPVHRRFGLATLDVNSAGPDLAIEGLRIDDAERLKLLVVHRAGDLHQEP